MGCIHYLQPLVNTLGVELMVAGEDPEQLPCLKVAEADNTPGRTAQSVTSTLMAEERLITEPEDTHPPLKGVPLQSICTQRAGHGAQHSQRLFGLMAVWIKSIGRKLLDVCFSEASGLGVSQPLGQAQEGLYMGRRAGSETAKARAPISHLPGQGSTGPHSSPSPRHPHPDPG